MAVNRTTSTLFAVTKLTLENYGHTWSSIANVFNHKPFNKFNYRLLNERKGLFDVPMLTSPEGFFTIKDECLQETNRLVSEAVNPHRKRKIVEIFDEISNTLCKVADLAEFIRIAHPDLNYTKSAEVASSTVSGIVEKLNTNYELYGALKQVVTQRDIMATDEMDEHVARLFLLDFEQSGIHLPDNERLEVVNLNSVILRLGQHFSAGVSLPRFLEKASLPSEIADLHPMEGKTVVMGGFHADADNAGTREFAYRMYLFPEQHQEFLLTQMLECRHKLAQMCDFDTYSQRALVGSLAEDPSTVMQFLNLLNNAVKSRADQDYQVMLRMKIAKEGSSSKELHAWDVPYYSYKVRCSTFKQGDEKYRPYLSLGACMEGLNILMQALFQISFVPTELSHGEAWHPDVYKLAVTHDTDGLLGYIYCDLYARDSKQAQDCHFTIQGGRQQSDGTYQLPIVALLLNFPTPSWSSPSLLTPSMLDNLFHEMGHAMHSMLARTKFQHVTGTRCCTDLAEVPSILMEYFANDPRVLRTFTRHYLTGDPMPEDMIASLCASKHLFTASDIQLQLFYSVIDQIYHGNHPLNGSTTTILENTQAQYYGIPYVPLTAWQLRFSHLVGYGAKYYSYIMSKAVACWIWQTYFQNDPFSRTYGNKYRHECLHFGGGKPPRQLVSDFLQKEIDVSTLVVSLVNEIDDKNKQVQCFQAEG